MQISKTCIHTPRQLKIPTCYSIRILSKSVKISLISNLTSRNPITTWDCDHFNLLLIILEFPPSLISKFSEHFQMRLGLSSDYRSDDEIDVISGHSPSINWFLLNIYSFAMSKSHLVLGIQQNARKIERNFISISCRTQQINLILFPRVVIRLHMFQEKDAKNFTRRKNRSGWCI